MSKTTTDGELVAQVITNYTTTIVNILDAFNHHLKHPVAWELTVEQDDWDISIIVTTNDDPDIINYSPTIDIVKVLSQDPEYGKRLQNDARFTALSAARWYAMNLVKDQL